MIYLLLDDFWGSERLAEIKRGCGDPEFLEMNTVVLDGQKLALADLVAAAGAVPFMALGKRLVVVRGLLARYASRSTADSDVRRGSRSSEEQALSEWLGEVPETTELVFVEEVLPSPASRSYRSIARLGQVVQPRVLEPYELAEWIRRRVKEKGGRVSADAVGVLAASAHPDLRLLDTEIEKLVVYAGGAEIGPADVRALVSEAREGDIFAFVDAVGRRDQRRAIAALSSLLAEGEPVARILVMIARQLRLLLQIQEQTAAGENIDRLVGRLRLSPHVIRRLMGQARSFSGRELNAAYRRVLGADQAIKSGQLTDEVSLDLLVADLTGTGSQRPAATGSQRSLPHGSG